MSPWLLDEIPPPHLKMPFLAICSEDRARFSLAVGSALLQAHKKNGRTCILVPTRDVASEVIVYFQEVFSEIPVHSPYAIKSTDELRAKVWVFTPEKFLNKLLGKQIRPTRLVFLDAEALLDGRRHILEAVLVRVRPMAYWPATWLSKYDTLSLSMSGFDKMPTFQLSRFGEELGELSPDVITTIGYMIMTGLWRRHLTLREVRELLKYLTFTQLKSELKDPLSVEDLLANLMGPKQTALLKKHKGRYTLTAVGRQVVKYGVLPSVHGQIVEMLTRRGVDKGKLLVELYRLLSGGHLPQDTLMQLFSYKQLEQVEDVLNVLHNLGDFRWRKVSYTTNQITHIYSKLLPSSTRDLMNQFSRNVKTVEKQKKKEQKAKKERENGEKTHTWRFYNEEGLLGKITSYLKHVKRPITVKEVSELARVGRSVARNALEELSRRPTYELEKRVLTDVRGKRALYGRDFPEHLEQMCGGCQFWVVPGRCSVWQTVSLIDPLAVPIHYQGRAELRLRPGTFACQAYRRRRKKRVMSWETFTTQFRRTVGWEGGREQSLDFCPICSMEIPPPSTTAQACDQCRTIIKLTRKKTKDQVEITPDRKNELRWRVHELTGLLPDELPSGRGKAGILLFETDKPRIQGGRLYVDLRSGSPWSERLERVGFVVARGPLPAQVEAELRKQEIRIIQERNGSKAKNRSQAAPNIRRAVAFARATDALAQALTVSNILSRLNFLVELCHTTGGDDWEAWYVVDCYLEAHTTRSPEALRRLEGRTGVYMWTEVKRVLQEANIPLQSRTAERWVREILLRPGIRGAAYSAASAFINFVFATCYEALREINGETGLGYFGTPGVLHFRRTKSAVDTIGLLLDLAEPFKLAYLQQLIRDTRTKQIRPGDIAVLYGRARKMIFHVPQRAVSRLRETCQRAAALEVEYEGRRGPLLTAYRWFASHVEQFLRDLLMHGLTHTVAYQGQHLSHVKVGMEIERFEAEVPTIVEAVREEACAFTARRFSPFVYTSRSEGTKHILTQVGGLKRWF